ncbi:MAG: acyl-CoA dehydrogenase family protein [Actinomycetota bacterium]|nr:acyl-CoA dehydrogenase family protein [Actinomycetota bacterium]
MTAPGNLPDLPDWPDLDAYRTSARAWLTERLPARSKVDPDAPLTWGEGEFTTAVFHNLTESEQRSMLERAAAYQKDKCDAGYGAITLDPEYGGSGLPNRYERAFRTEESRFDTPDGTELFGVTVGLIAPTILAHGTDEQKREFVRALMRTEYFACQLFSEPGAGSDLAALSTRADRDGDSWIINGQKVWTSGAQFSRYGELIARSDLDAPKHKGMTAFMVPFDASGVTVRPIRQMSGGTSFNEVFFDDVRIPDSRRLGAEGEGWRVALTTLGFERMSSGGGSGGGGMRVGGSWPQVLALARHLDCTDDPVIRQDLADLYVRVRLLALNGRRAQAKMRSGQMPGPEGSIGKALWTQSMARMTAVVSHMLGPRLGADSGEWGTFGWGEHVLGAPGYRIAGGSDEIQRNIIGERVLGLPGEPRVDRDVPFRALAGPAAR